MSLFILKFIVSMEVGCIKLTEEEKQQGYGTYIRNGESYFLIGHSEESFGFVSKIPYEKDWDLNK